jgi:FG-GAP-like repeat/Secretion system C-terminal sorting domain
MRTISLSILFLILPMLTSAQLTWTDNLVDSSINGAYSVHAADLDGDGDEDVVGVSYETDEVFWWENIFGHGQTWFAYPVSDNFDGAASIHTGDVDGDGDLDIVGAANYSAEIAWWENLGGGQNWSFHQVDDSFDGAYDVLSVDVDVDGDLDILGAARYGDDITWWENDGTGLNWTAHQVADEFDGVYSVFAIDLDGDLDIDILGAARFANEISWWENDGAQSFTEHTIIGDFEGAWDVHAADVDGDGDTDVLGASRYEDSITWWENLGLAQTWAEHELIDDFNGASIVYATDLDDDGDMDVLGGAYYDNEILWWENLEAGVFWASHAIAVEYDGPRSIDVADLNGDGYMDVLGGGSNPENITWWQQTYLSDPDLIDVDIIPYTTTVPGEGGTILFRVSITNNTGMYKWGHAWSEMQIPGGEVFAPLTLKEITVPAGVTTTDLMSQIIPYYAPEGTYTFSVKLGGFYMGAVVAANDFTFTKAAPAISEFANWGSSEFVFSSPEDEPDQNALPTEFAMNAAFPNPFNPSTTVQVTIPERSNLTISVFNVAGQQVSTLTSGTIDAGQHQFTFDAHGLASGLYFIYATVPGQMNEMQKVMLVR